MLPGASPGVFPLASIAEKPSGNRVVPLEERSPYELEPDHLLMEERSPKTQVLRERLIPTRKILGPLELRKRSTQ